jgi:hypothetical protein
MLRGLEFSLRGLPDTMRIAIRVSYEFRPVRDAQRDRRHTVMRASS